MTRPVSVLLLLALIVLVASACERPIPLNSDDEDSYYTHRESEAADGTGRFYMGREIAQSRGFDAAEWLERSEREYSEMPQRVVRGLDLRPSDRVADVGAGTGYFTFRVSKEVPKGIVYAVEIDESFVDHLKQRKRDLGADNVRITEGSVTNPQLPTGRIDVALMVSAYHEFSHPREMKQALLTALRPGGRAVVVEYRQEDPTVPVDELHRMTEEQVREEFEASGFRWRETRDFLPQQHFVVFEKPIEMSNFGLD